MKNRAPRSWSTISLLQGRSREWPFRSRAKLGSSHVTITLRFCSRTSHIEPPVRCVVKYPGWRLRDGTHRQSSDASLSHE